MTFVAGLVQAEHDQILLRVGECQGLEKLPDEIANQAEICGVAGKFDFALH